MGMSSVYPAIELLEFDLWFLPSPAFFEIVKIPVPLALEVTLFARNVMHMVLHHYRTFYLYEIIHKYDTEQSLHIVTRFSSVFPFLSIIMLKH